jgi:hypothetical protein
MMRILVCFVAVFSCVVAVNARTVELTLFPAKAPDAAKKYHLLPTADEQTDSDAFPLYQKAVRSLPADYGKDKVSQWRSAPLKELPIEQVKATLEKLSPSLQLLRQAGLCRRCSWPAVDPVPASNELTVDLSKFRELAFLLAVQARLEIAQGRYDQAVATARMGFVMARHFDQAPTLIHGLVGVAIGALMCKQLEEAVQYPDAPNLYWALQSLPRPLIDLNRQIELEMANLEKQSNPVLRRQQQEQLKPSHDRVRVIGKRFDRDLAALQCVEAIRLHAATHGGKFPNQLSDITDVTVPVNPATGSPFVYSRSGSKATLEGLSPGDSQKEEVLRYEMNLKE